MTDVKQLAADLVTLFNAKATYKRGESYSDYVHPDDNKTKDLSSQEQHELLAEMRALLAKNMERRVYDGAAMVRYCALDRRTGWVYGWHVVVDLVAEGKHLNQRPYRWPKWNPRLRGLK